MDYIRVSLIDMPVDGLTVRNPDGGYTILIDAGLSAEAQCEAYDHEMEHINNQDYDHIFDVNIIEWYRHKGVIR